MGTGEVGRGLAIRPFKYYHQETSLGGGMGGGEGGRLLLRWSAAETEWEGGGAAGS
jgi:hypothetical protein